MPLGSSGSASGTAAGTGGAGTSSGFYTGAFVPVYGYGFLAPRYNWLDGRARPRTDPEPLGRVTGGLEAMPLVGSELGITLGISAGVEGERWGFNLLAQNISARAKDDTGTFDQLQQINLHLTYAILVGKYGRLRLEAGADTVFAGDLVFLGPDIGASGVFWIAGPLAFEGAVGVTPFPYRQLDSRAGLVVGIGPVGVRIGWRLQVLDDQGYADGDVHRDTFTGPYVGMGLAL